MAPRDLRKFEIQALLSICELARDHDALKENLAIATYLDDIVADCRKLGINVDAAARFEAAKVLWDQKEPHASIRALRTLAEKPELDQEDFAPGQGVVLAKLVSDHKMPSVPALTSYRLIKSQRHAWRNLKRSWTTTWILRSKH